MLTINIDIIYVIPINIFERVTMCLYKCSFPGCDYTTESRSKIDYHHVTPREIDPKSKITLPLCKTHHALIYVPESKCGQHSIKSESSLIILGQFKSTMGNSIHFESVDSGNKFYYFPDTGDKWDD